MPGIYIAAAITTVFAVGVVAGVFLARRPRKEWRFLALAGVLTAPLSPLAFHLVRLPFDKILQGWLEAAPGFYHFLTTFYAPLTEEPAKLWPLLIPAFARRVNRGNAVWVAVALGLGFGVGEIWMLAERIAIHPDYADLPFYLFTGFLGERTLVCIMHGAFTAAALVLLRRRFFVGVLAAMGLHYVGNFPIYLGQLDPLGFGKTAWQVILSIWVLIYFFAMLALLARLAHGEFRLGQFCYGMAKCPECGHIYPRPLWALNLGKKRYERCPACKKWHTTREYHIPPGGEKEEPGNADEPRRDS
ncbi:MAG: hypothetical protein PVH29_02905 [Candidatus Zixiibacteriota bacterium]|jgi:hypothetical protein